MHRCSRQLNTSALGSRRAAAYLVSTVGKHGDEDMIGRYVKNQGQEEGAYKKLYKQAPAVNQLKLW